MKKNTVLMMFLAVCLAGYTSCKKDKEEEEPEPTPAASQPTNPIPAPGTADGALVAVKTITYVQAPFMGEIAQEIGVAVAAFGNLSTGTYVDAGAVSVNGSALTKQSNNSYVYTPGAANVTGIDFEDTPTWNVAGNSSVQAISDYPVPGDFPSNPNYKGTTTIATNAAFNFTATEDISADSVLFVLISPSKSISKTLAGPAKTASFTAAEMGSLGKGNGYVQIVPYNISSNQFNGKTYYFINEAVFTKSATFN